MRIIGDNSHGFENENQIRDSLNMKMFEDINPNLRNFLIEMFRGYDLKHKRVHAIVTGNTGKTKYKPDFYVTIDEIPGGRYVSVKNDGSGHSLHQEKLETFIPFLKSIGVSDEIIKDLLFFHWSDETYDNTGSIRYNAKTFTKNHKDLIIKLNEFFKNNKHIRNEIINRGVFKGKEVNAPLTDYLYVGSSRNGVWASRNEIYAFSDSKNTSYDALFIGPLTYQIWNADLKRQGKKGDNGRKSMQFKWGDLHKDVIKIGSRRVDYVNTGTYAGDISEKASVILFNKDPESDVFKNYLKTINKDPKDVLLIRVTTNQLSKLSNQRVKTRADAYAIEIVDSRIYDLLEENDFYLDEDILDGYDSYYNCIEKSGISIKRDGSGNYTLIKLTPNSFKELFDSYELGYGASVFCKNSLELHYNIPLLNGWKTTIEDLQEYFRTDLLTEDSLTHSLEICQDLKRKSIEMITNSIDNSPRLQSIIFNGKDIYDEPYSAYFFMQNNIISLLGKIPYNITTGSGRSHGDYSIVLKPRN